VHQVASSAWPLDIDLQPGGHGPAEQPSQGVAQCEGGHAQCSAACSVWWAEKGHTLPRATQSAWSWCGNLAREGKGLPSVFAVLNASPELK